MRTRGKNVAIVGHMLVGIDRELQSAKRELADAQASARRMCGELSALQRQLAVSEERGHLLQEKLDAADKLRRLLKAIVANAETRIQQLALNKQRITALEELLAALGEKEQELTFKLREESHEIEGLKPQLLSERELRETLEVDLDVSRHVIDELKQALARAQETPP